MGNRFFINIKSDRFKEEILFETQGDLPIKELLIDILKNLNWPIEANGVSIVYRLSSEDRELKNKDTLISAGVENFETIWISPDTEEKGQPINYSGPDLQASPVPSGSYWSTIPVDQPSLIHPEGYIFILDRTPLIIGRRGGVKPVQIDLTELEKDRLISSRCHAEIYLEKGKFFIRSMKTRNGMFVGRDELLPGETHHLNDNDVLQFGVGGVRLIFREPFSGGSVRN